MNALSDKCLRMKLFRFALETKNKQRRLNIKKKKNHQETKPTKTHLKTKPLKKRRHLMKDIKE